MWRSASGAADIRATVRRRGGLERDRRRVGVAHVLAGDGVATAPRSGRHAVLGVGTLGCAAASCKGSAGGGGGAAVRAYKLVLTQYLTYRARMSVGTVAYTCCVACQNLVELDQPENLVEPDQPENPSLALPSPSLRGSPTMAAATLGGSDVAGGYGDLPDLGVDDHVGLAVDDGGSSSNHSSDAGLEEEDLEEEEEALSMEDRVKMAEIWVANTSSSHHWTSGAGGGLILNDDVWELRIHFDCQPNIDMKLCSSDVTFMNLYAVLQTQGFYFSDELYHMRNLGIGEEREHGLELIDTNIKLQQVKKEYNDSLVLNLLVRATPTEKLAAIVYRPPILYDLSEPVVLVVDPEGVVFHSNPSQPTAFASKNNNSQLAEEEDEEEDANVFAREEPPTQKPAKRRKKLAVRKCPTTRSHSSVLEEVILDFIPSADEEDDWLLFENEDDGHEPPSFVLPKGRKSRAKKRKPRIWYNDKLEQPHQQLCVYMCFKDQHQFREALLSLHITQARDFGYHRSSDQRIIACCKQDHCQFCIVAAVIKGEKTFAIKKMRLEHTCPTNTDKSRISAKWLANTYESLFRSDPTTSIHTLMDNCREKFGVDVGRRMAYRAENLAIEVVLGEHKKQYPRLRDYAQTIMDTNLGT
ncbi:hypothetical protein D1007_40589 [Hordeum vulgare]|nr:hypothetical protein D1007_40589 [Hordeum vulgare]